jgi:hypothetical protein
VNRAAAVKHIPVSEYLIVAAFMASFGLLFVALLPLLTKSALAETNVYGQEMTDCGPNHASGCTYSEMDMGAHQVCVTKLPHGFSSETGQGSWSDKFTGRPWCICIWAYSNYILHNKDLPLKCESIPATVLEEQYSLDKFKQCGSMSSTEGCGAEDIRRSIQSLCQQCDAQTGDQGSKTALKAKCDAILASAPAAPMQRLYEEPWQTKGVADPQIVGGMSSFSLSMFGLATAGFAAVGLLAFRVGLRTSRIEGNSIPLQDSESLQTSDSAPVE